MPFIQFCKQFLIFFVVPGFASGCFSPIIDQSAFSAFYNESEGVVLTWSTNEHERDPDIGFCESSRTFRVLTRSYASYIDYITRGDRPDQVVDLVTPEGSKFVFPESEVRLGNYYVFDVQSQYHDNAHLETFKVSSPLYYFGPQGKSLHVVNMYLCIFVF